MTTTDKPVQLFLSYTRKDEAAVAQLYERLAAVGFKPWMDQEDILPGELWQESILHAIRDSHFFLACISPNSVDKRGFLQRELREALDAWQDKLPGDIYLIPVRLEDCAVPEQLSQFQWVDLFHSRGWTRLLRAIQRGTERLGLLAPDGLLSELAPATPGPKTPTPTQPPTGAPPAAASSTASSPAGNAPAPAQPKPPASPDLLAITKPIHLELVRVPAGPFLMGDDKHTVDLPEYYIGKYPVTNQQYAAFVQVTHGRAPYHWKEGKILANKEKHPVVYITWDEAVAFCQWLSQASGHEIRLPSQAEWEKAARGVDGLTYPWGNEPPPNPDLCNFADSEIGDTTPVDRYPTGASPCGALDMAGNVWEWSADKEQTARNDMQILCLRCTKCLLRSRSPGADLDRRAEDADREAESLIADIIGLMRGPAGRESRICGIKGSELVGRARSAPILPFRKSCSPPRRSRATGGATRRAGRVRTKDGRLLYDSAPLVRCYRTTSSTAFASVGGCSNMLA